MDHSNIVICHFHCRFARGPCGTVWCVVVGGKDDSSGEFIHGHYESNSGDRAVIMGTEHVPNGNNRLRPPMLGVECAVVRSNILRFCASKVHVVISTLGCFNFRLAFAQAQMRPLVRMQQSIHPTSKVVI